MSEERGVWTVAARLEKEDGWVWYKKCTLAVAAANDCECILSGEEKEPVRDDSASGAASDKDFALAVKVWKKKDSRMLSYIVSSMGTACAMHVVNVVGGTSAHWKALEDHFERDSEANKLMMRVGLYKLGMGDSGLDGFVENIKYQVGKLAALKVVIGNDEMLAILIKGIDDRLVPVVAGIYAVKEIKFEDAVVRFKDFWELLEGRGKDGESKHGSLAMRAEGRGSKGVRRELKDVQCYGCKAFGHYRSECPEADKGAAQLAQSTYLGW